MCIRDSAGHGAEGGALPRVVMPGTEVVELTTGDHELFHDCLLYTSDAADERSSVDLGGRRIIKKKKKNNI